MCGPVQLKTGVCLRIGRGVGCAGKTADRQAPLCMYVCEREREGEGGAGASGLEPKS